MRKIHILLFLMFTSIAKLVAQERINISHDKDYIFFLTNTSENFPAGCDTDGDYWEGFRCFKFSNDFIGKFWVKHDWSFEHGLFCVNRTHRIKDIVYCKLAPPGNTLPGIVKSVSGDMVTLNPSGFAPIEL